MTVWYLVLLVPIGIGMYLVWDHRHKSAARAAASAERLNALLGATPHVPTPTPAPDATRATVASASADIVKDSEASLTAAATPDYALRERLLTPAHTLLYYLLKTGLPEHHVFAHVTLRSLLEPRAGASAYARNEQTRRLSWHAIDFVVCDRNLRPIAAVELSDAADQQDSRRLRKSWIESAGLRYLELDAKALPRKEGMRALVLNEAEAQRVEAAAASST